MRASHRRTTSRRTVLAGVGALALGTAVEATGCRETPAVQAGGLPVPADCGIDHIIVLMMENRSFDHYLGWLPGADGKQGGLTDRGRAPPPRWPISNSGISCANWPRRRGGACDYWAE
ncbi:alkaline phosphatase family protein [Nocardia tengchongensis]